MHDLGLCHGLRLQLVNRCCEAFLWQSESGMLFFHCGSSLFSACRIEVCKSIPLSQGSLVDFQPHGLKRRCGTGRDKAIKEGCHMASGVHGNCSFGSRGHDYHSSGLPLRLTLSPSSLNRPFAICHKVKNRQWNVNPSMCPQNCVQSQLTFHMHLVICKHAILRRTLCHLTANAVHHLAQMGVFCSMSANAVLLLC